MRGAGPAGVSLAGRLAALLDDALAVYTGTRWTEPLRAARADLGSPLRVAFVGRVKSGKSTLLNAVLGHRVAATDTGECTRVPTWYAWGPAPRAWAVPWADAAAGEDAGHRELVVDQVPGGFAVRLGGLLAADLARIRVELPVPLLQRVTLVDTPGTSSLTVEAGARTERLLDDDGPAQGDDGPAPDAVVYLMRQVHAGDVTFLEAFRGRRGRHVAPVHAVGVLSRADEVGGGRADALALAAGLAAGYTEDPRLRPLVQSVVPVAGLLAEAAATLDDAEHADLVALAALPPPVTGALLLSVSRFVAPRLGCPVPPERRARLLDRLGVFGVRAALAAIRDGAGATRDGLAAALARASGLARLGDVLRYRFVERAEVLQAQSALRLVERAVAEDPRPGGRRLLAQAERIRLGVHDLAELRVLDDLRRGALNVPAQTRVRMERLLGAHGSGLADRLGAGADGLGATAEPPVPAPPPAAEVLAAEHRHWRAVAVDPLAAPELARAAAVLQRTCEGMLAELGR